MTLVNALRRTVDRLHRRSLRAASSLARLVRPGATPPEAPAHSESHRDPNTLTPATSGIPAPEPEQPAPDPVPSREPERLPRPLGAMRTLLEQGKNAMSWPLPRSARPQARPSVAPGARYEARRHDTPSGSRDYRLYVPASASGDPAGLLVMLHGCKQDPDDFAAGTDMNTHAERAGFIVAYPGQSGAANAMRCWNWFSPENQRRDAGEPAIIAGITRALIAEFGLEGRPVMVAGLSAGGAMSAVMGATYPDLFTAIGIHSGLPHGAASDAVSAVAAMRGDHGQTAASAQAVPTIVFHGDADRTVHPGNATRIAAAIGPGDTRREAGTSAGGRPFRREILADATGRVRLELWMITGGDHAWSGGSPTGSYTDPDGPDASAEIVRFMLATAEVQSPRPAPPDTRADDAHPPTMA
jgi:poly(hydroxyalkanoate) depolymerase family esterase